MSSLTFPGLPRSALRKSMLQNYCIKEDYRRDQWRIWAKHNHQIWVSGGSKQRVKKKCVLSACPPPFSEKRRAQGRRCCYDIGSEKGRVLILGCWWTFFVCVGSWLPAPQITSQRLITSYKCLPDRLRLVTNYFLQHKFISALPCSGSFFSMAYLSCSSLSFLETVLLLPCALFLSVRPS